MIFGMIVFIAPEPQAVRPNAMPFRFSKYGAVTTNAVRNKKLFPKPRKDKNQK